MDPGADPHFAFIPILLLALAGASAFVFVGHLWLAFAGADRPIHVGIAVIGLGSAFALFARYAQLVTPDPLKADFAHRIFVALLLLLQVSFVGAIRAFARVALPWRGIVVLTAITLVLGVVTLFTNWTLTSPSIQYVHLFGWRYSAPTSTPAQLIYLPLTWGTLVYSGLLLRSSDAIPREEHHVLVGVLLATVLLVTNNCLLSIGILPSVSLMEFVPPLSAMALSGTILLEYRRLQTRFERQVGERTADLTARQAELETLLAAARGSTGARARVLAHMSHVLRSSLEGIAAATSLLAEGSLTERVRPQLDALRLAIDRLVQLVTNVIEAARLGDDRVVDEQRTFGPLAEFETALDAVATVAKGKGIALGLEVAEAIPRSLLGDAARLRQLLGHLLDNAVRYTGSGRVQLRARVAKTTATTVHLRVEIEDSGPGLSTRARSQIFEPFLQAEVASSASQDGHGLGLALARAISERLGGSIGVESEPGRGSTFWFEVPFTRAKSESLTAGTASGDPAPTTADATQGRRLVGGGLLRRHVDERPRVLVIESDATNQRLLKALLSRLGFGCDVVPSGAVALETIGTERYGLVLVDCAAPAGGGDETIRRLRALDTISGPRLPIVALIAHAAAAERVIAAGASDRLTTPIDPGRLATVLARWLTD